MSSGGVLVRCEPFYAADSRAGTLSSGRNFATFDAEIPTEYPPDGWHG